MGWLRRHGIFLGILVAGILARLFRLGTSGFSIDEMTSLHLARAEGAWYLMDTNPPLYHALLRAWTTLAPLTEFWVRLPSVAFSAAALLLMMKLCLELERSGKLARPWVYAPVLVLALLPRSFSAAHEARMGALWELWTVLLLWSAQGPRRPWTAFAWLAGAATHWLALVAQTLIVIASARVSRARKLAGLVLAVGLALLAMTIALRASSVHLDWQTLRFGAVPLSEEVPGQLAETFGSAALLLLALAFGFRYPPAIALAAYAVFLLLATVALGRSLFLARYLTPLGPLLAVTLGFALQAMRPRWAQGLVATCAAVLLASGLVDSTARLATSWRPALAFTASLRPTKVFSSRTAAIATPYLEPLRVNGITPDDVPNVVAGVSKEGRIAVIDNYWGGLLYTERLLLAAREAKLVIDDRSFNEDPLDPVRVITLTRPVRIALTVDDVPSHGEVLDPKQRLEILNRFIAAFDDTGVEQVYGFINGAKVDAEPSGRPFFVTWKTHHHRFGNHGFRHTRFSEQSPADFVENLSRNLPFTTQYVRKYFRFPFLDYGESRAARASAFAELARTGHAHAHVTVDTSDWQWNKAYLRCLKAGDATSASLVKAGYLRYAIDKLEYARRLAGRIVDRDIPLIFLTHSGVLQSETIKELIEAYKLAGASFVSLDEATKDPFYLDEPLLPLEGKQQGNLLEILARERKILPPDDPAELGRTLDPEKTCL